VTLLAHCSNKFLKNLAESQAFFIAIAAFVKRLASTAPVSFFGDSDSAIAMAQRLMSLNAAVASKLLFPTEGSPSINVTLTLSLIASLSAVAHIIPQPLTASGNDLVKKLLFLVISLLATIPSDQTNDQFISTASHSLCSILEFCNDRKLTAQTALTILRVSGASSSTPFSSSSSDVLAVSFTATVGLLLLKRCDKSVDTAITKELVDGVSAAILSTRSAVRRPALTLVKTVLQTAASDATLLSMSGLLIGACGPALDQLALRTCSGNDLSNDQLQEMTDVVRIVLLAQTTAPQQYKANAIGAALGVLLPMLAPNATAGSVRATLHQTAFQVVMHFASSCAADFRVHLSSLDATERSKIETAMRTSAEAAARAAALAQQQQEKLRQSAAARSKPLSLDFSKYGK